MGFLKIGDYCIATIRRPNDCIVRIESLDVRLRCTLKIIFGFGVYTHSSNVGILSELTLEKATKLMRDHKEHCVYDKKELSKCIMKLLDNELDVSLWQ